MKATLLDWVDGVKAATLILLMHAASSVLILVIFIFITAVLWVLGVVVLYIMDVELYVFDLYDLLVSAFFGIPPKPFEHGIYEAMFEWKSLKIFFGIMAGLWLIYAIWAIIDMTPDERRGKFIGHAAGNYDDPPYPSTPYDSYDYPY